ncbi:MAG: hypothetical protein AAF358_10155 [Pseudomonadota bacterium]
MDRKQLQRRLALAISIGLGAGNGAGAQEAIELRFLDGSNGFSLNGVEINSGLGGGVSGAGDFNGDGLNDLLAGAENLARGSTSLAGGAYLVFGSAARSQASIGMNSLNGINGFVFGGENSLDGTGRSVGGAGDVNGDGLDDLIIGARGADPGGNSGAGISYVVFGRETGFLTTFPLSILNGNVGFAITGEAEGDLSGIAVSGAGDVNGDGFDDVLVGASGADPVGGMAAGRSYVVFGSNTGFSAELNLTSLNGTNGFVIDGISTNDFSGSDVCSAGDVNGDGFDDLLIGAPYASPNGRINAGVSYLVFGFNNLAISQISLSGLSGTNGFAIPGILSGDNLGRGVSGAGDVNGDGFEDIIISADNADAGRDILQGVQGRFAAGITYVVFGSNTGFSASLNLASLDGTNGFAINGVNVADRSGSSVSGAGDVNGDGLDDLLIGAPFADPQGNSQVGVTYVVFGSQDGFPASLELGSLSGPEGLALNGFSGSVSSGSSVSGVGDVNGDGIDDVLIGAPLADPGGLNEGAAFVVYGNTAPMRRAQVSRLFPQLEDELEPLGSPLDTTLNTAYLDIDPFGGAAIIADQSSSSQGNWQFSADGATWTDVPLLLGDDRALVLAATDQLRFSPARDYSGQPGPLRARLWDGRWRDPGLSVDITSAIGALGGFATDENLVDVTVEIIDVNDPPSFAAQNPPAINEDSENATIQNWASFNPGPASEANQFALAYQVENISNPGLFSVLPTIGALGNLVYVPAPNTSGSSSFDVRVVDSGGMANGGVNVSAFQSFSITVNPVNDPPQLTAEDPPTVPPNSGPQSVANWATFDPGAPDELQQLPSFVVLSVENADLFAIPPAIDAAGNLTYTPAVGAEGTSEFTALVRDNGGTENGGRDRSTPQTFTVRVLTDEVFANSFESRP